MQRFKCISVRWTKFKKADRKRWTKEQMIGKGTAEEGIGACDICMVNEGIDERQVFLSGLSEDRNKKKRFI